MTTPKTHSREFNTELEELREKLRDPKIKPNSALRREALQNVLSLMTQGISTSALFSDMLLACATESVVEKKMVYFYLSSQAEESPELALMAVNTLQKDCGDPSPVIRGVALRALSSLNVPEVVEYLAPLLRNGFNDRSGYVRKTAVIAAAKLFYRDKSVFHSLQLLDTLISCLRDSDNDVLLNALMVVQELLLLENGKGLELTKNLVFRLLNRIRDFNEWHTTIVLQLVTPYIPSSEEDMYDIMNLLDNKLQSAHSGVVLSCVNFFMQLSQHDSDLYRQVIDRVREPLITATLTAPFEISYACLSQLHLLVVREPRLFMAYYREFYLRHTEPLNMKLLKLEILSRLVFKSNAENILSEMIVYSEQSESQSEVACKALHATCAIALKIDATMSKVVGHMLSILSTGNEILRENALMALRDIAIKYRSSDEVQLCLDTIIDFYISGSLNLEKEDSLAFFVQLIGELSFRLDKSPYILESFVESFSEQCARVQLEILTSSMKCFFAHPPAMQKTLGKILHCAMRLCPSHTEVHYHAQLYYTLLKKDVDLAKRVVSSQLDPQSGLAPGFMNWGRGEVQDLLLEQFNTLSPTFGVTSKYFIRSLDSWKSEPEDGHDVTSNEPGSEVEEQSPAKQTKDGKDSKIGEEAPFDPLETLIS